MPRALTCRVTTKRSYPASFAQVHTCIECGERHIPPVAPPVYICVYIDTNIYNSMFLYIHLGPRSLLEAKFARAGRVGTVHRPRHARVPFHHPAHPRGKRAGKCAARPPIDTRGGGAGLIPPVATGSHAPKRKTGRQARCPPPVDTRGGRVDTAGSYRTAGGGGNITSIYMCVCMCI